MKKLIVRRIFLWSFLFLGHTLLSHGQSSQQLSLDAFLDLVRKNHPNSKQAFLLDDQANAALQAARGGFDPKLYGDWSKKSFDQKNYFNIGEGGVKLPTWFGIEGKLGYNYANGLYLNPENNLPSDGQLIAGITVPLLQGLIIDERRANLSQAKLLSQINRADRRIQMNDLLFNASKVYWDWAFAYAYLEVYEQAVNIANQRFEATKEAYLQGDEPAIDTLEAYIQLQDRTLLRNDAQLIVRNAGLLLQNYFWENDDPGILDTSLRPISLRDALLSPVSLNLPSVSMAASSHPEIISYDLKINNLEIDRKLKAEQLKPRLDVSYNLLGDGIDIQPETDDGNFSNLFRENYKLGVNLEFPLLLRKERGSLRLTDLKIMDADFGLKQKRQEVQNKILAYQNELSNLQTQVQLAQNMRDNYNRLLAAENEKFAIGESSLFLINSRENKLIEAELKLAKLQAEIKKVEVGLLWAAGRLE